MSYVKSGKLIRRYEHNGFRGWVVSTKRRGRRWVKYFSDRPAGRMNALRCAREYRDQLHSLLPPATKVKRTYVLNTTGVVGVALVDETTRAGKPFARYVASWPTASGTRAKVTFSLGLYGKSEARRLAVRARRQGLVKLGVMRRTGEWRTLGCNNSPGLPRDRAAKG